ncbi:MAG: hypothetical protein OXN97_11685 [Bryobacterales bacterium]|nr:hypothetical protein [Bryobacterales bacterium]
MAGPTPLTGDAPPPRPAPPLEWPSVTHRFSVGGHKGYITVAVDGDRPVHVEIRMAKAGGVLRGLLDSLAVSISLGLRYGVPLAAYVDALAWVRFEPSGWTAGEVGYAHSIVDYVVRWIELRWPDADRIPGLDDPPDPAPDGETCGICGWPRTWEPGDACPECGHVNAGLVRTAIR